MKLCHEDAWNLVQACRGVINAYDGLCASVLDAMTTAPDLESLQRELYHLVDSRTQGPSTKFLTRIEMEEEFYKRNLLRLRAQAESVAQHRMRKKRGWTKKYEEYDLDGKHAGRIPASDSPGYIMETLETPLPRPLKQYEREDVKERPWRVGEEFPPLVAAQSADEIPAYALVNNMDDYRRLGGPPVDLPEPLQPLFKVKESEAAKESDGVDELTF